MDDPRTTARRPRDTEPAARQREDASIPLPRPRLLWFAFLGAPVVWAMNLLLGYAIQATACDAWNNPAVARLLPALCSLLAAAVAVIAVVLAHRMWRGTGVGEENPEAEVSAAEGRTWFMSYGGLLTSLLFLLAIILTGVAELTVSPCSWL
jgi:hypothetical protein